MVLQARVTRNAYQRPAAVAIVNPNLRGVAFGAKDVLGTATLALFDDQGRELRRVSAEQLEPMPWGWLLFGFEPLPDSRWKTLRFQLELPTGSHLVGTTRGPARVGFYGGGAVDARLGGMTQGVRFFEDRDLLLRAWSASGPGLLGTRLWDRLGWKAVLLTLAWLLASLLLPAALGRAPRS